MNIWVVDDEPGILQVVEASLVLIGDKRRGAHKSRKIQLIKVTLRIQNHPIVTLSTVGPHLHRYSLALV